METLDVGVLTDVVYPFTHGGAEKRIALLSQELAARGHQVTVYAMDWWEGNGGGPHVDADGVRYVAVGGAPRRLYANGARRSLVQPALYGLRALRGMRGVKHDVVDCNQFPLVHLPAAQFGSFVQGHPVVVTWHEVWQGYWFRYAPLPAGLVGAALEDVMPHLAALNIAVSHHTAARLRRLGVRRERVTVVPNAIDLGRIDAVPPREQTTDVVFVGRLVAHKRVDRLLGAMAALRRARPGVRCTILGSGPEEARLRALARGLGLDKDVEFTGAVDEDALLATMKSAKLFVSASEREGFGVAALEAMACGLPVITVDAPMNALAEELVLDGYNGSVVRAPNARSLASGLLGALEDEGRRRQMGAKARLTAEGYDKRRIAARLEGVYKRTVEGPAPPAPEAAAAPELLVGAGR